MHRIVKKLTFLLLCSSTLCWGGQKNPENIPAQTLPEKAVWIENMQKKLPLLLCQKEDYFVHCFNTTSQECEAFMHILVKACTNSVADKLPSKLTPEQGKHWGEIVGGCSYDLYEKVMQIKKKDLPDCRLPATPKDKSQKGTDSAKPSTSSKKETSQGGATP